MGKACQCRQPGEWTINSRHACMQAFKVGMRQGFERGLVAETTTPTELPVCITEREAEAQQHEYGKGTGILLACVCVLMTVLVLMSFTHGSRQPLILRLKV